MREADSKCCNPSADNTEAERDVIINQRVAVEAEKSGSQETAREMGVVKAKIRDARNKLQKKRIEWEHFQ